MFIIGLTGIAQSTESVMDAGLGVSNAPRFNTNGSFGANADLGLTFYRNKDSHFGFQFMNATITAFSENDSLGTPFLFDQNYCVKYRIQNDKMHFDVSSGAGFYLLFTKGDKEILKDANQHDSIDYETDAYFGWCLKQTFQLGIPVTWGAWGLKSTLLYMSPVVVLEEPSEKIKTGYKISVGLFASVSLDRKKHK